jgi:hypothetical protein
MIEYIYFVKCPNCEDEPFDFFNDAKDFAMSCISKKPVITQTEVNRNDFGECTDYCDLGTVWSWEETMKDIPAEPEDMVFSKSETFGCKCGGNCKCEPGTCKCHDLEFEDDNFFAVNAEEDFPLDEGFRVSFDNKEDQNEFFKLCRETGMYTPADLDRFMQEYEADDSNLLDKLRGYKAEIDSWDIEESCERKPIPEGMAEDIPSDDYYVITTTEGGKRYYIRNDIDFKNPPEDAYEWFTHDLDKAQLFSSRQMAGGYFVERKLADNVFALGPNNRRVSYYDYVKTPYECWLIDTSAMKESCERKPIPEGMTIEQLVEEMEENEDTVECALCQDLFDKSTCRKELNLGWLCSRCADDLAARGEGPVFKEDNYWDFLDEEVEDSAKRNNWDYDPKGECEFTAYDDYGNEVVYYVPQPEVLEALIDLVDDEYIQFQTKETDELRTVQALKAAGKLREFLMDDFSTHVSNYSLELEDYFKDTDAPERAAAIEASTEEKDDGPGRGAFRSWNDFWSWKEH